MFSQGFKGGAQSLTALWLFAVTSGFLPAQAGGFDNRKVLVLGIDGLRGDTLQAAEAPNLQALAAQGTVSWDGFVGGVLGTASQQPTVSGPGWATMATAVWADKHGIVDNSFSGYDAGNYPHFFRRIKEYNPAAYLSSIIEWSPVDTYLVGPVDAFTDYRQVAIDGATTDLASKAAAHLASADPDVLFLYFDEVDYAGHNNGYSSTSSGYLAAIAHVDAGVGTVLAALRARPGFASEDWLILATTDHGGIGTRHGGQTIEERTIFVIVSGGQALRQVVSPGPGLTCIPATALAHLGVPIRPEWGWESPPFGLAAVALTNDLSVYLNFDDNLDAQGGTTRGGTVRSGVARYTEGILGEAVRFQNSGGGVPADDWTVSLGNLEGVYSNSFSLSLWVRTSSTADAALMGNKDWDSGAYVGWVLSTLDQRSVNWNVASGTRRDVELQPQLSDGQWHLLSVTFDRAVNQVITYLDGVPRNTNTLSNTGAGSLDAGFETLIGASGPGTYGCTADLDDLGIWARVLAPSEIGTIHAKAQLGRSLLEEFTPPPVIVTQPASRMVIEGFDARFTAVVSGADVGFQWLFQGTNLAGANANSLALSHVQRNRAGTYTLVASNASGSITSNPVFLTVRPRPYYVLTNGLLAHLPFDLDYADVSGRGYHGTVEGNASLASGQVGSGALRFTTRVDGSEFSYVTLGNGIMGAIGTHSFSTAFWVRFNQFIGDPSFLSNKNWDSGANTGFVVAAQPGGTFKHNFRGSTGTRVDGGGGQVADGDWHHLAVTYQRGRAAVLYLDGEPQITNSLAASTGTVDSGLPLNIGQDGTGRYTYGQTVDITNGLVDDLGIWLRPLSEVEVAFLYLEGREGRTFDVPPVLNLTQLGSLVKLAWPSPSLVLQSSVDIANPAGWTDVITGTNEVTIDPGPGTSRFYRCVSAP